MQIRQPLSQLITLYHLFYTIIHYVLDSSADVVNEIHYMRFRRQMTHFVADDAIALE